MKSYRFWLYLSIVLVALSCNRELPPPNSLNISNGVIIRQEPLWKVPHDTTHYVYSVVKPYWQFDDKVIVETYKNYKAGIRCMEVETGKVIWEQYFEGGIHPQGLSEMNILDFNFNPLKGYLIVSIGSWGETEHVKLDIYSGKVLWRIPLEAYTSIKAYGGHYYCTVMSSDEVEPIYKVDIETGDAKFFYKTDLPPHPDYHDQRGNAISPFEYDGREILFVSEVQMTSPTTSNNYFCLIDAATKEHLLKHIPTDSYIRGVEVRDEIVYLFTGEGYKIFSMETLDVEHEVKLLGSGEYQYHTFYEDRLIIGFISNSYPNGMNGHYVVDLNNHNLLYIFEDWVHPPAILDDILYYVTSGQYFKGYDLTTGDKVINMSLNYNSQFGTATYKNEQGKKFVVVGDVGFTYCFEGI